MVVEKHHARPADDAGVVDGSLVVDVVVAGDHHAGNAELAQPTENFADEVVAHPLMVEQVADDEHHVDLVAVDQIFDHDERAQAVLVVIAVFGCAKTATEMHVGGMEEA